MATQIVLRETIAVSRPITEVFWYLSDFSRCEDWDPGVLGARRLDEGSPREGMRFEVLVRASLLRLRMTYRLVRREARELLVFEGRGPGFLVRDEIRLRQTLHGTSLDYHATFMLSGPWSLLAKYLPARFEALGRHAVEGLRDALQQDQRPIPLPGAAVSTRLLPELWRFTRFGYRRARAYWHPVSSHLQGQHIVITGATSGLGLASAWRLAEMGAELTLVVRDSEGGAALAKQLREQTGNPDITAVVADLSLMRDVVGLADRLLTAGKPLDVLINNAGALFNPRQLTDEGLEASFALLLLAPFVLTERLKRLLMKARAPRVINVASGGMYSQKLSVDELQSQDGEYSGAVAYARAKRALVVLTQMWATEWTGDGIRCHAMHPGWADTPGLRRALPVLFQCTRPLLRTKEEGADTIVWLASSVEAGTCSGLFWLDRQPRPTHLIAGTQESARERQALRRYLQDFLPVPPMARTRITGN